MMESLTYVWDPPNQGSNCPPMFMALFLLFKFEISDGSHQSDRVGLLCNLYLTPVWILECVLEPSWGPRLSADSSTTPLFLGRDLAFYMDHPMSSADFQDGPNTSPSQITLEFKLKWHPFHRFQSFVSFVVCFVSKDRHHYIFLLPKAQIA